MSYSSDLKDELLGAFPKSFHCRAAELAGIISVNGRMVYDSDITELDIRVENEGLEDKVIRLLKMVTDISDGHIIRSNEKKHHRKLIINDKDCIDSLKSKLKLHNSGRFVYSERILTERQCCKKAFLRGSFLAGGAVGTPEKSYQLEIDLPLRSEADKVKEITDNVDIKSNVTERRNRYVVYVKDGNSISYLIGLMGATNALMEFENIRIIKDIRNHVNREVNCDTANMAKTASASKKQIEDISYISDNFGLDKLPEPLKVMAELRLEMPYSSFQELGERLNPPLGKSGVSKRLRKLSEVADELRKRD